MPKGLDKRGRSCISEQFDSSRPIYAQLVERLKARILAGTYPPGGHLDSVRDLAAAAGVNPNTMQRAMMEMEREELVYRQRTAGRFVTEDGERIRRLRESLARNQVKDFLEGMYQLGFQLGEIVTFVQTEGEKGHHEHSGV